MNVIRKFVTWCNDLVSENGVPSTGRFVTILMIASSCMSVLACTYIVVYLSLLQKKIPERVGDIVAMIGALTGLSTGVAGVTYGMSKFSGSGIIDAIKQKLGGSKDDK